MLVHEHYTGVFSYRTTLLIRQVVSKLSEKHDFSSNYYSGVDTSTILVGTNYSLKYSSTLSVWI